MRLLAISTFRLSIVASLSLLPAWTAHGEAPLTYEKVEVLHKDVLNESQWVVEQMPGGVVNFDGKSIEIDDSRGCTVWFKHRQSGPVLIEFEATMIKAGGPNDNARDLNCFWMAIDPMHPTDIFANNKRTGRFPTYDSLRLYYVGYGGHRNTQTRFRRYNGLGERPLLPQHDLSRPEYMITPNQAKRIQIVVIGNRTQYIRDGEVIFDFTDPQPYREGWFAFRTVSNHMIIRDFKVTRLAPTSGIDADPPLMPLGGYADGYSVHQISAGNAPAMHSYMDICPESPDGSKIAYFEFENNVPGWGYVVVANRDGSEPKRISERIKGHDHDGARQQWIDNDRIIYGIGDDQRSEIYSLKDKSRRLVEGEIGMVSEAHGFGLTHNNYPKSRYQDSDRKPPEVSLMNLKDGTARPLLSKSQMLPLHPKRDLINAPQYQGMGVFKHPKWSPDGSQFFWVYMLELKETGKKLVKSALLSDRNGDAIRYVSEVGQHPMWHSSDTLLSYIRKEEFDHHSNPSAQTVMAHPTDGRADYPIIDNALGIHGSLSPNGAYFATDIFDWPEPNTHAVLLYDVKSGSYRELVRMRTEKGDTDHSMHPHPSWSRDGKRIYFNGSDTGERRLYAIDLSRYSFKPVQKR